MPADIDAFIRAILADPADALAKLVFADWLDEAGEHVWAEYIRLRARADYDRAGRVSLEPTLTVPAVVFGPDISAVLDLLPATNYTVTVDGYTVPRPVLGRVTEAAAALWRGLPLARSGGAVLLGMVVPTDREAVGQLARLAGGGPVPVRVPGDQLAALVERTFTRALALPGAADAEVTVTPAETIGRLGRPGHTPTGTPDTPGE